MGRGNVGPVRLVRNSSRVERPDVTIDVGSRPMGGAVVHVGGELDVAAMPQLRACLTDLVSQGRTDVVLDLRDVTFCDSSALGVFIGAHQRLHAGGGQLELHEPPSTLRNLLTVSGLDQVLDIR